MPRARSLLDAALVVLGDPGVQALHVRQIAWEILRRDLYPFDAQNPEESVGNALRLASRSTPPVVNHGGGYFQLIPTASPQPQLLDKRQLAPQLTSEGRRLLTLLESLDYFALEHAVALICSRSGFNEVEVTPRSGDKGVDIRATKNVLGDISLRVVIQVRSGRVGTPDVRELKGSVKPDELAILVGLKGFTYEAWDVAHCLGEKTIELLSGPHLVNIALAAGVDVCDFSPLTTVA